MTPKPKDATQTQRVLDYDELPPLSRITCERNGEGVRISVPGEGFERFIRRVSRTPRFWVILCFMAISMTWPQLGRLIRNGIAGLTLTALLPLASMVPALLIGWTLGLWLIAQRRAELSADGQALRVMTAGFFMKRCRSWPASTIRALNHTPYRIQVIVTRRRNSLLKRDRRIVLLPGRDERELSWVARTLRDALGVPETADGTPAQTR